jgi:predicted ATPase
VSITDAGGLFDLAVQQPGMLRPLRSAELSDGTLRFLLWAAALLSPRPPSLMVLNEPETSLHPDLVRPLATLIRSAAKVTQVLVVTHSRALIGFLGADGDEDREDTARIELYKDCGETLIVGQTRLTAPSWDWGSR